MSVQLCVHVSVRVCLCVCACARTLCRALCALAWPPPAVSRKPPGPGLLSSSITHSQPSCFTIILKPNAPAPFNSELCLFACGLFYCKIKILKILCLGDAFFPKNSMVVLKAKWLCFNDV